MRDCENVELRDRLPELLHDRLRAPERERVQAHLESCAECAAEWSLMRDARAVLVASAPRVNVDVIARAVAARLPVATAQTPELRLVGDAVRPATRPVAARRASPWSSRPLRAAAAVVVMAVGAGGIVVARRPEPARVGAVPTQSSDATPVAAAPVTPPTSVASIESTTPRLPTGAAGTDPTSALGATFSDLSDEELAAVIRAVDSDAGLPPADSAGPGRVVSSGDGVL